MLQMRGKNSTTTFHRTSLLRIPFILANTTTAAPDGSATGSKDQCNASPSLINEWFSHLGMARINTGSFCTYVRQFVHWWTRIDFACLAVNCSSARLGSIASSNGSVPPGWRLYSHSYTATHTSPTLSFAFETHGDCQYYLDEVSVTDNDASSIQLLHNPSFDQSATQLTAWETSCEATCWTKLVAGVPCLNSSGQCLLIQCGEGLSSPIFLSQSFVSIIGHTYSISYALSEVRDTEIGRMSFYVDVIWFSSPSTMNYDACRSFSFSTKYICDVIKCVKKWVHTARDWRWVANAGV